MSKLDDRGGRPEHQWTIKDRPSMAITPEGSAQPSATGEGGVPVLFSPWEAEQRVEQLEEFDVTEVGTGAWMKQHESLEQLNLQAHQSAQQAGDEFVLETLITFDKLKLLVHELLAIEAWRLHVFPRVKRGLADAKCSMRAYFCLFHEATLVNLLALCLHHAHACEALGDGAAVELVDYLARRLVDLSVRGRDWAKRGAEAADRAAVAKQEEEGSSSQGEEGGMSSARSVSLREEAERLDKQTPLEGLENQATDVIVQVSVGSATLVRYVCEHLNAMPVGVMSRVVETHDMLVSLVPVLENPPWTRRLPTSGQWQKLVEDQWKNVPNEELLNLTKTEGQVWLALYSLVSNPEVRKRYHFNSFRKAQLLRARKYMNEVLLDQLPVLADVQRFMDELAMMEAPHPTAEQGGSSVLRLQQVGAWQEKLGAKARDWSKVAEDALSPRVFGAQTDAQDKDLQRLVDNVYGIDGVDDILDAEAAASKSALYSQPLGALCVSVLALPGHSELLRVEYDQSARDKAKPVTTPLGANFLRRRWCVDGAKAQQAAEQQAVEQQGGGDAAAKEKAGYAEVPFSKPGDAAKLDAVLAAADNIKDDGTIDLERVASASKAGSGAQSGGPSEGGAALPFVLKAECGFLGLQPFSVAVASEAVDLPTTDDEAQGGAFPRKLWVQLGAVKENLAVQVQLVRAAKDMPYKLADAFVSTPAPLE